MFTYLEFLNSNQAPIPQEILTQHRSSIIVTAMYDILSLQRILVYLVAKVIVEKEKLFICSSGVSLNPTLLHPVIPD
jgi:hypothetical protein